MSEPAMSLAIASTCSESKGGTQGGHRLHFHRIYDLRSTFISNALAGGLTVFETARIAGTSVKMIEQHYGALIDTARESLLERLEGVGQIG
jgi:hypothetical protein